MADANALPSEGGTPSAQGLPSNSGAPVAKPLPGTPEYDAAVLAKAGNVALKIEGQDVAPTATAPAVETSKPASVVQRPAHIPEKFWDAEKGVVKTDDLAKSYAELERARTAQPKPDAAPAVATVDAATKAAVDAAVAKKATADALPDTDPGKAAAVAAATAEVTAAQAAADTANAKATVQAAGVDYDALAAEFAAKGELSAESLAALDKAGIKKPMVDAYIAGQQAIANEVRNTAFKITGGTEESYRAMTEWMKTNVPAEEIAGFNKLVSGNKNDVSMAVSGMYARYVAANGSNPTHEQGGNIPKTGTVGYNSLQEMSRDMKDPRYSTDPAYRAKVEAKAAATTAF